MKSFIFVLLLLAIGYCYIKPQFESGKDTTITWSYEPMPINQGDVPRLQTVEIKFANPFPQVPQIALSTSKISWGSGSQYTYDILAENITSEGFILKYTSYSTYVITALHCEWLAILDPQIQVVYFQTSKLLKLNNGSDEREEILQVNFNREFQSEYEITGTAMLIGTAMEGSNPYLKTNLFKVTNQATRISVQTNGDTKINMIKFCVIAGPKSVLWITSSLGYKAAQGDIWLNRPTGLAFKNIHSSIPPSWLRWNKRGVMGAINGFRGFETAQTQFKAEVTHELIDKQQIKAEIGTWGNAKLKELYVNLLVYQQNDDFIEADSNCVEAFSECYFTGYSVQICQSGQMQPLEHDFPIKSILVPEGKVFKLYDINSSDPVTFRGINTCFEPLVMRRLVNLYF